LGWQATPEKQKLQHFDTFEGRVNSLVNKSMD
jgi:hypothetical protein